ncbi:hypothetical protein ACFQU7_06505 [Pseudoroseomonas wenyumeiae]
MAAEALRDAAQRAGFALTLDTGDDPAPAGDVDAVLLVGEAAGGEGGTSQSPPPQ